MDSTNKNQSKNGNASQNSSYNPWNLFSSRSRTESETSVSSTSSQNSQSSKTYTIIIVYYTNTYNSINQVH